MIVKMLKEFIKSMGLTMICIVRGHVITTEGIKHALESSMRIVCERCGVGSPIEIDEDKHVRIKPTGDPEIFISGSDLGHIDEWK